MKNIKRLAMVLLAVLLIAASATTALAASYVEATGTRVNVRSGPGSSYSDLYTMVKGEKLEYLGSAKDSSGATWYKIQYYSYGTGWVHSQYARIIEENSYVQASGGKTYLRTAPNLNGSILSTLQDGQKAEYLNQTSTDDRGVVWYRVSLDGEKGWVSSRYTKLVGASASNTTTLPEFNFGYGSVKITGGSVNVRKTPNLNGKYMGGVNKGDVLDYQGQSSTDDRGVIWYKVEYEGEDGWVSSRYSELTNSVSLPDFSFTTQYVKADDGNCNVRSTPNLNGTDLGTMKKGEKAEYLGSSSTDDRGVVWYKVSWNGKTGWVSSRYASIV